MPASSAHCRGSVIAPVSADAAAVSGEHSQTLSSLVPERPGKLRGMVRSELCSVAGACPIPMHPMQPAWCSRAPLLINDVVAPILVRSSRISREVGLTSKLTSGEVCRPSTIAAAMAKSRSPGLALDPMTT